MDSWPLLIAIVLIAFAWGNVSGMIILEWRRSRWIRANSTPTQTVECPNGWWGGTQMRPPDGYTYRPLTEEQRAAFDMVFSEADAMFHSMDAAFRK
jgi:hypothetical protein